MKFLAVFVTLAAVAFGYPDTTTWTLDELSEALQNPNTDPILIPYLEAALNEMMWAIHHGEQMETITIAMPIVVEYTYQALMSALEDPDTPAAYIPYLEEAANEMIAAVFAGNDDYTVIVVLPPLTDSHEVHPDESGFIDVWPIATPEESPAAVSTPSSPLVQIIVNVKQQSPAGDKPSPVEVVDSLPGWGNFI